MCTAWFHVGAQPRLSLAEMERHVRARRHRRPFAPAVHRQPCGPRWVSTTPRWRAAAQLAIWGCDLWRGWSTPDWVPSELCAHRGWRRLALAVDVPPPDARGSMACSATRSSTRSVRYPLLAWTEPRTAPLLMDIFPGAAGRCMPRFAPVAGTAPARGAGPDPGPVPDWLLETLTQAYQALASRRAAARPGSAC